MRDETRHKWDSTRKKRLFGVVFAIGTVIPAAFLAIWTAFTLAGYPLQGGGLMVTTAEKLHFLGFIVGMLTLIITFSLAFQFPAVLVCRFFCSRKLVADLMLDTSIPNLMSFLGWHDWLMLRWINFLWGTPTVNRRCR